MGKTRYVMGKITREKKMWKSLEVGGEMESKKIVVYASQKMSGLRWIIYGLTVSDHKKDRCLLCTGLKINM